MEKNQFGGLFTVLTGPELRRLYVVLMSGSIIAEEMMDRQVTVEGKRAYKNVVTDAWSAAQQVKMLEVVSHG